ncbi:MAG TPA: cytidylate kinase-like family protein [Candidatus Acidoferrum sp.]|nr:cytidylate kinase-like family protein [Candidatus Acidoferrum sp.]
MVFRAITVEREYGSGGANIARRLSEKLGWKLWDQNITAEIARVANVDPKAARICDERVDSLLSRLFRVYARGSYERSLPVGETKAFNTDRMFAILHRVIESIADQGNCVIVGRGSPYFLRNRPDVFRIFVYAPLEEKIRRVMALGKSEKEARQLVEEIDRERATFIRHYFNSEWPHRPLYHLMVNSAYGDEHVIDTALHGIAELERRFATETV